jgi:hypothetical protein
MPKIIVAPNDVCDVIAYILGLKGRDGSTLEFDDCKNGRIST